MKGRCPLFINWYPKNFFLVAAFCIIYWQKTTILWYFTFILLVWIYLFGGYKSTSLYILCYFLLLHNTYLITVYLWIKDSKCIAKYLAIFFLPPSARGAGLGLWSSRVPQDLRNVLIAAKWSPAVTNQLLCISLMRNRSVLFLFKFEEKCYQNSMKICSRNAKNLRCCHWDHLKSSLISWHIPFKSVILTREYRATHPGGGIFGRETGN